MGASVVPTVTVRHGVLPGRAMPTVAVPLPLFSPAMGSATVYPATGS